MTKTVTFKQGRFRDTNQWRWVLAADNHEPLAMSSESYTNAADCVHAFELTTGALVEPKHQRVAVRVSTVRVTSTATTDGQRVPVEVTTQVTEALDVEGLSDE